MSRSIINDPEFSNENDLVKICTENAQSFFVLLHKFI